MTVGELLEDLKGLDPSTEIYTYINLEDKEDDGYDEIANFFIQGLHKAKYDEENYIDFIVFKLK